MILEGTTSSGAVVPVQVTTDGKVVAEGRTGPEGPQGPEGPEGPQGPEGPAGSPGNLWSGSDPGPIYYTGGSVGIGTSSVAGRLQIKDNGYRQGIVLERAGSTADRGYIYIGDGTNSTVADEIYLDAYNTAFHFRQGGAGTTETVTFKSDGKVGIGTASPTADGLHIFNSTQPELFMGTSTNNEGFKIAYNNSDSVVGNVTNTPLRFVVGNSEKAAIDSSGRLLVGTTTAPAGTLTGDIVCQGAVVLQSPNGTWWAIEVEDDGTLSVSQTSVR